MIIIFSIRMTNFYEKMTKFSRIFAQGDADLRTVSVILGSSSILHFATTIKPYAIMLGYSQQLIVGKLKAKVYFSASYF